MRIRIADCPDEAGRRGAGDRGEAAPLSQSAIRNPQSAIGLRLAGALWRFWSIRGHLTEGRRALERLLALVPADHPELGRSRHRARALVGAGALAHDQGDYPAARALLEEALPLWREGGDRHGLATCLNILGNEALDQGDHDRATAFYEEALEHYRSARDTRGRAMVLGNLGTLAHLRGDLPWAAELLDESVKLKRTLGNRYGLAISLDNLGNVERGRGNLARAVALYREGLTLRRELEHRLGVAMSLNNLGSALLEQGDAAEAGAQLRESLALFRDLQDRRGLAECLAGLAAMASAAGRLQEAARLGGAAAALRGAHGIPPSPAGGAPEERWLAAARGALGEAAFATAWTEGEVMSTEQTAALILAGGPAFDSSLTELH